MRIHTKLEYIWDDTSDSYVLLHEEGFDYYGPVDELKGPSSSEQAIAANQQQFQQTLMSDYGTQFANQSAILSSLNNAMSPIIAAGPSQFGFSQGEVNSLNSSALTNTGQSYKGAQQSLQNQEAAHGGDQYLPSGVNSQNSASLATAGANQESNQLQSVQQAGWTQGNQNYNNAVNTEMGVSSQYNPTGYAGATNQAGSSAFGSADTVSKENNAASPWTTVGGILGGVAGSFLGPIGGALGSSLGSSLAGGMSGGGGGGGGSSSGGLFGGSDF